MPMFLNTFGRTTLAIGICDRCKVKMSLDDMSSDRNAPGLRVCAPCNDEFDPYRLPARKAELISVRNPRLDVDLNVDSVE